MDKGEEFCIIHNENIKTDEHLTSPTSHYSWITLVEAAKIREHELILEVARNTKEGELPNAKISYHRQCRSTFTLKRDLETVKRKREEKPVVDENLSATPRSKRTATSSRVLGQTCIFCAKDKYINRIKEKLVQATQLRVDQTLRRLATSRCDERIVAVTSRDIVAAEAHYHRSCYREYTRPKKSEQEHGATSNIYDAEKSALTELFSYIRSEVLELQRVISMVQLTKKLEAILQSKGVQNISESSKKHLRRTIQAEFGSSLEIFPDDREKLLVIPGNLSIKETVKKMIATENELENVRLRGTEMQAIVDQSAQHLRSAILYTKWTRSWPILPSDLSMEQLPIPECLRRFFLCLLTSNPELKNPSSRVQMLVESFSQDMIYAVTCGKTKPPKQILLSYGVKTLTGNVEIIQMLNRFGHGACHTRKSKKTTPHYVSRKLLLT